MSRPQAEFTALPNWLLDEVMPNCDPNEWRIVCVVARKTLGWGKELDRISLSQFTKLSGIKSRPTVKAAIDSALANGFITRQIKGNSYEYGLISKPVQELNQFKNQTDNGLEIKPKMVQKLNTQKKKEINKEYIYDHGRPEKVQEFMAAIASVVKTALTPGEREELFESAAYTLIGWDATIEQIKAFSPWWEVNGYDGLPALKSFLDEYRNYQAGKTIVQQWKTNNNHLGTEDAWQTVKSHASRGDHHFTDIDILEAVKQTGWPAIQRMTSSQEYALKKTFEENYENIKRTQAKNT